MQLCWELEPEDRVAASILETRVNQVKKYQEGILPQEYECADAD